MSYFIHLLDYDLSCGLDIIFWFLLRFLIYIGKTLKVTKISKTSDVQFFISDFPSLFSVYGLQNICTVSLGIAYTRLLYLNSNIYVTIDNKFVLFAIDPLLKVFLFIRT